MKLVITITDLVHTLEFCKSDTEVTFAKIQVFSGGRTLFGFARALLKNKVVDEVRIFTDTIEDLSDEELKGLKNAFGSMPDMS